MTARAESLELFETLSPFKAFVTARGLRVAYYAVTLERVPVDFFADPDGLWTFDTLVEAADFSVATGVAIGALSAPFNGHPEGSAVVTLNSELRPYVAVIECPIAFACTPAVERHGMCAA